MSRPDSSGAQSSHSSVLTLLDDLVLRARKKGASAADALLVDGVSLSVTSRLGVLEKLERAEGGDIGLRVLVGQRQALVSSGDRSPRALEDLVDRAVAMAKAVPEDSSLGLADPSDLATDLPDIDGVDPREPSVGDLSDLARRLEDAGRAVPGITNSEGAEASWSRAQVSVVASNGFAHTYATSRASMGVAVVAGEQASGMEMDYASCTRVYVSDLEDPTALGREAGERAVRRLKASRLKTGCRPVIFESRIARSLVGHFLDAINGASLVRGTSFLKNSLGESVFGSSVSIIEDPHRARGLRSRPCDVEGLATRRRALVESGRLTGWLLDLRTARALGLHSTANASRATGSAPTPAPSNVWLEAGSSSLADLMGDISDGLYITDLFGQGVNGVTGDYSRRAAGFRIEKGQITTPVNEITIAGTLQGMFAALTPADDLHFRYGTDSPSVRIDGMMVAGT